LNGVCYRGNIYPGEEDKHTKLILIHFSAPPSRGASELYESQLGESSARSFTHKVSLATIIGSRKNGYFFATYSRHYGAERLLRVVGNKSQSIKLNFIY
jgi:hypothetical protein